MPAMSSTRKMRMKMMVSARGLNPLSLFLSVVDALERRINRYLYAGED